MGKYMVAVWSRKVGGIQKGQRLWQDTRMRSMSQRNANPISRPETVDIQEKTYVVAKSHAEEKISKHKKTVPPYRKLAPADTWTSNDELKLTPMLF